jgi:heme/copper-type cytochrome/quinol oxidase subunit 2
MEENLYKIKEMKKETKIKPVVILLFAVLITLVILVLNSLIYIRFGKKEANIETEGVDMTKKDPNESIVLTNDPAKWPVTVKNPITGVKEETKLFAVEIKNDTFSLNEINVQKGEKVQIGFTSLGTIHDVFFPSLSAYIKIEANSSGFIIVDTASLNAGEYPFTCRDFCPINKQMEGKLIIQ